MSGVPPLGGARTPRGRDDLDEPKPDTEDMELLGSEIVGLLTSPALLITAAATTLVLLSGMAANALLFVEDLHHRWVGRSPAGYVTGAQYGVNVGAELKSVR